MTDPSSRQRERPPSTNTQLVVNPGWVLYSKIDGWGSPQLLQTNVLTVPMFKNDCFLRNLFLFITHESYHHLILCNLDCEFVVRLSTRNLSQKFYTFWDITPCSLHAFIVVSCLVFLTLKIEATYSPINRLPFSRLHNHRC
jgi:hypothetical protein